MADWPLKAAGQFWASDFIAGDGLKGFWIAFLPEARPEKCPPTQGWQPG